jgi:signal transduction histidine kinase
MAQNNNTNSVINYADSLKIYSTSLTDSATINRVINFCFAHKNEIPDLAFTYSKKCYEASKKEILPYCEARSVTNLGAIEVQRGNYATALTYYMQGLLIWEKLNYKKGIMFNKNNIAQVYGNINKPDLELKFLIEALQLATDNNYEDGLALINDNLSVYHYLNNDFRKGFNYATKAVAINLKLNKLSDACRCYSNAGDMLSQLNKLDSALIYFNKAKVIATKINDNYVLALCYANMASTYNRKKETDKAIYYHEQAIALSKKIGEKDNLVIEYNELASIYTQKKEFENALSYTLLAQGMKDSIHNLSNNKQIAELQTKYDTQNKDLQILAQEASINKRNYLVALVILLMLALGLVAYARYRKSKLELAFEVQKTILEQQTLAVKAVYEAGENERRRIAQDLHDNMGAHTTSILAQIDRLNTSDVANAKYGALRTDAENIMAMLRETIWILKTKTISIHNFYDLVKSYANKQLKQTLDVSVVYKENITAQRQLSPTITLNLYRVIQESIQNTIKHANATQVLFTVTATPQLTITISDNGTGFDVAAKENKSGLENMQFRANEINYTLTIQSATHTGTTINITENV